MNYFKKDMVLALEYLSLLLLTSVKVSSGRPLAPLPSTLEEELSLREP